MTDFIALDVACTYLLERWTHATTQAAMVNDAGRLLFVAAARLPPAIGADRQSTLTRTRLPGAVSGAGAGPVGPGGGAIAPAARPFGRPQPNQRVRADTKR